MNITTKTYLDNLYVYLKIMNNINKVLKKIINTNWTTAPDNTTELFYLLTSEILRIMPYKREENKIILETQDGIFQLKGKLNYIEEEYNKLATDEKLTKSFLDILTVRNKFTHEPHNLSFGFSVSGENSCSIGIYYKNSLQMLSTIDIQVIVKKLNIIFIHIRKDFINLVKKDYKEYMKYPMYKKVLTYKFEKFNDSITILPKFLGKEWFK